MKKHLVIFGAIAMMLLLSVCIPFYAHAEADTKDVIENGIFIGDIDVSGMTEEEAAKEVSAYIKGLSEKQLTLNAMNDNSITVSVNDLGFSWENEDVATEAVKIAKGRNLVARYKALKDLEHENVVLPLEYSIDRNKVMELLRTKCEEFNVKAEDAAITRENGEFVITPGQTGVVIDNEASADLIMEHYGDDWDKEDAVLDLSVTTDEPRYSDEELSQVKDLLGSFTTDFSTSGSNRSGNVANGCRLINDSLLLPGEEFSVYKAVSPFTTENGYYMAGSYLNGMVVDSLGGGICQVSTTLYNAVLRAELEVTDRSNHSMIVSYVDPSADAAISGTKKDMKFINNTDHPIYIEGYTANKKITFNIYGVETRPENREVKYESEILSRTNPTGEKVVGDGSRGVGYISVQSAHVGYTARLWKIVTVDGKEESREIVNESSYAAVPRTATVGTATSDPTVSAAIQAAIASQSIAAVKTVLAGGSPPAAPTSAPSASTVPNITGAMTPEQIQAQQQAAAAAAIAQQQATQAAQQKAAQQAAH